MRRDSSLNIALDLAIAVVLAAGAGKMASLLHEDTGRYSFNVLVVLLLAGGLVGFFRPGRTWHWPLACFLGFAAIDLLNTSQVVSYQGTPGHFLSNAAVYLLQTVPVTIGTYAGNLLMHRER